MLMFVLRRLLSFAVMMVLISIAAFAIIQLPPGDFITTLAAGLERSGDVDTAQLEFLRQRFGLDQPIWVQYWRWISAIVFHGDFGYSFMWKKPVADLIWDQLGFTLIISIATLLFSWVISFPIGVYSAVRQYSWGDFLFTFIGFIGLAVPNFLLALILMYVGFQYFGQSVGGLYSPEFQDAAWSWGKFMDLLAHLWIPIIVIGASKTAELIRIMRANLLDELNKPYVTTARAKGMTEVRMLVKYPIRLALNPFVSTVGWVLPSLISGAVIASVVLNLPTVGPILLNSLQSQDMYLAGAFILLLSLLTLIGTLVSDILLAWLDPRIRLE
ncbi:MAG: dipeptide/oligopeptide transporter permease protein [Devosia sp.]|uniref:ABC transporter permease n=1 Tax=Devosia sp. TaxID=1871048 RepID=UPI00261D3D6B|nr:ABC transporter permease [Devosia sp.]MDB5530707.1 dipeptide/oligopeptide transporter permease protein [Devosia sp.]